MISKLFLKNFQSIREASFDFAPVTAIVGDSDIGKSALVRAFYAISQNRSSAALLHKGKGPLLIELTTSDGHVVSLERPVGKSSFYTLDGVKYDKTSREVPEDIAKVLGFRSYQVDKDVSVLPSVQRQLDPQFLIQQTDSVISKTLGHISKVSVVFVALRKVSADVVASQNTCSSRETLLESTKRELLPSENVPIAWDIISAIRQSFDKTKQSNAAAEKLRVAASALDKAAVAVTLAAAQLKVLEELNRETLRASHRFSFLIYTSRLRDSIKVIHTKTALLSESEAFCSSVQVRLQSLFLTAEGLLHLQRSADSLVSLRAKNNQTV
ncbi:AAA family ATPase, partial [Candidatus Parcubacteria bacterium]|nr:AAA family ATPase [Candidatus Parcubacteria bacterium]